VGRIILATATMKLTNFAKRAFGHKDVSEGSEDKPIASRIILGRRIDFYRNGRRMLQGIKLTDQEKHDSEILRFTHASMLIGEPCGNKKYCYVDATQNPVEIWLFGHRIHRASDLMNKSLPIVEKGLEDEWNSSIFVFAN